MSNDKQKAPQPQPKKVEKSDSAELDSESLDGVSGGMGALQPAIPGIGPLLVEDPSKPVCITQ
jgi:hypothetical protein